MLNDPKTRIYLKPFLDLNRIFAIFTSTDGVDQDPKPEIFEKIKAQIQLTSQNIVTIMRNWIGLIYLGSSNLGLQSLVEALTQSIRPYKKIAILDLFIEIFNIPISFPNNESLIGSTMNSSS